MKNKKEVKEEKQEKRYYLFKMNLKILNIFSIVLLIVMLGIGYLFYRNMSSYKSIPLKKQDLPLRIKVIGILYNCLPMNIFKMIRLLSKGREKI